MKIENSIFVYVSQTMHVKGMNAKMFYLLLYSVALRVLLLSSLNLSATCVRVRYLDFESSNIQIFKPLAYKLLI